MNTHFLAALVLSGISTALAAPLRPVSGAVAVDELNGFLFPDAGVTPKGQTCAVETAQDKGWSTVNVKVGDEVAATFTIRANSAALYRAFDLQEGIRVVQIVSGAHLNGSPILTITRLFTCDATVRGRPWMEVMVSPDAAHLQDHPLVCRMLPCQ